MESNAFENLGAEVTLDRGNTDFRGNFDDALGGGFDEILACCVVIDADEQTLFDHVIECFEGHVRIDRAATVADECAEMVHFTWFARFQNEADFGAFALANQEMVQARNGEQRGHGGVIVIDATVA